MAQLDAFNWETLTQAQARRMVAPAARREQAAAAIFNAQGSKAAYKVWIRAANLEEDLRVFAITGEKP